MNTAIAIPTMTEDKVISIGPYLLSFGNSQAEIYACDTNNGVQKSAVFAEYSPDSRFAYDYDGPGCTFPAHSLSDTHSTVILTVGVFLSRDPVAVGG